MDFTCLYRKCNQKKGNIKCFGAKEKEKASATTCITIPVPVLMDEDISVSGTICTHCTFNFTGVVYSLLKIFEFYFIMQIASI